MTVRASESRLHHLEVNQSHNAQDMFRPRPHQVCWETRSVGATCHTHATPMAGRHAHVHVHVGELWFNDLLQQLLSCACTYMQLLPQTSPSLILYV